MSEPTSAANIERRPRAILPRASAVALAVAVLAILVIASLAYSSLSVQSEAAAALNHTTRVQRETLRLMSTLDEAETGQRGFLLTGGEGYLGPYTAARAAIPEQLSTLVDLTVAPDQRTRLGQIEPLIRDKLTELGDTIELERTGQHTKAVERIKSDRGKLLMDRIRVLVGEMLETEQQTLALRTADWERTVTSSTYTVFGGVAMLLFTVIVLGVLASRDYRRVATDAWMRRTQVGLTTAVQGEQRLETIGAKVLRQLVESVDAQIGAMYLVDSERLRRLAGHALPPDAEATAIIKLDEGLVGQAAAARKLVHLRELPASYFEISSATGSTKPSEVVIVPAVVDGVAVAVFELGFLHAVHPSEIDALSRVSEVIAVSLQSARERARRQELLEETQAQAEELQAQQEELRVTNEELEHQTRALQLSQSQLENQQAELEQINEQLAAQTRSLGEQRDELVRAGSDLQRANEYKSQFLANMSHELRTPLNSTLILAKLLADNRDGNLNAEQIKFARTIYGAGNDLLTLINDILDLSKIEAGMLDVRPEPIPLARLGDDLASTFQPVAAQKHLELAVRVGDGAPPAVDTDPTRLQQILKNLLSNALKFTETGGVTLAMTAAPDHRIAFTVTDTGIGIAPEQHELIFEAFRQADGATTRKFGGTGLGLSISRDLARLLGGDLVVTSAPGRGSTFTLTLPAAYAGPRVAPRGAVSNGHGNGNGHAHGLPTHATASRPTPHPSAAASRTTSLNAMVPATALGTSKIPVHDDDRPALRPPPFPDDRASTEASSRSLLVIEDDLAFARVLYDLAHELEFRGLVAANAEDGLALARAFLPSAIVLDVGLPDRSGLAVLDALKRDSRTRHLPVHVVSVQDHSRTALEMGAAGWGLKPIERDRLIAGIRKLEDKLVQRVRRVLIVEDDAVLRGSTAKLLGGDDVETVTAGTAAEALGELERGSFDCIVLDLALPDRSGLELLEELTRREREGATPHGALPPVIVYTGRSLSTDEVHTLEKFSRSIIVKGARSPERLLDEVTLFLHQVEAKLPPERQRMLRDARDREAVFEGRRILIAEDDVRNVFALSNVLEPKGAKVEIARNGREALQQLGKDPDIDLVLMDIMMPEMDGLEATRQIRADPRFAKVPIIALTAKAMADDRDRCLEAGANDYIAKPLDVDKLLSLARVWIRK
nr:response regulator [Kofleriaceae bacterium]